MLTLSAFVRASVDDWWSSWHRSAEEDETPDAHRLAWLETAALMLNMDRFNYKTGQWEARCKTSNR
jgi:hypothetical protein